MDVRIGKVTSISGRTVRVYFPDDNFVSGRLTVLQRGDDWVPAVNDTVLCVFPYDFNSDGYVIGGIA